MANHVAIIMDGNGRWAKLLGKERMDGHTKGTQVAIEILEHCCSKQIPYITLYALSLQNLNRPQAELKHITNLLKTNLDKIIDIAKTHNAKLSIVGLKKYMFKDLLTKITEYEEITSKNTGTQISVCAYYGGREEIVNVFQSIDKPLSELTTHDINKYFTLPDVDLIIRTGGENRISNFLVWQSVYAEYYFTKTLWPDFTIVEFEEILKDFQSRNRTFGKVEETIEHIPDHDTLYGCFVDLLNDYKIDNDQNIEDLYLKLKKNDVIFQKDEMKDKINAQLDVALCSKYAVHFVTDMDDIIDSYPFEKQCVYLQQLSENLSVESVGIVHHDSIQNLLNMNTVEKKYVQNIYRCEYLQRTTNNKDIWRYAAFYYLIKLYSKNLIDDELCLISSILTSFCDDVFDEKNEISELKYIDTETYPVIKNAIFDFYNKAYTLPYANDAIFITSSLLIHRFIRPTNDFKNITECYHYVMQNNSSNKV